jgi:beta-lactamase class A
MGQYQLVNPLLDCPNFPEGISSNKAELKSNVEGLIRNWEQGKNGVKMVAVHFRDLNNGPRFGVNTENQFIGASLMKTPVLIGFLKLQAKRPGILNEKVLYVAKPRQPGDPVQSLAPPENQLKSGVSYAVKELLEKMMVDSDNEASNLLQQAYEEVNVIQVLKEMGVPLLIKGGDGYLTVEDYSSIFRILFNATYLDAENSNYALSLMTRSRFQGGLPDGVTSGITIAHKFGERGFGEARQFHHCGIVYYPKLPYLLCVMTDGTNQEKQIEAVKSISKAVFEQIRKDTPE